MKYVLFVKFLVQELLKKKIKNWFIYKIVIFVIIVNNLYVLNRIYIYIFIVSFFLNCYVFFFRWIVINLNNCLGYRQDI